MRLPALLLPILFTLNAQTAYWIDTLAGAPPTLELAAGTLLEQVEGVAIAADGTIYFSEATAHRVRRIRSDGLLETIAGTGEPGFDGDGGQAAGTRLHSPYGLAIDREARLLIADLGNGRVRRIETDGTIRTVAGGGSVSAMPCSDGIATECRLLAPRNLAPSPAGGFYLSDFLGHAVYRVDAAGRLSTVTGTGTAGYGFDHVPAAEAPLRYPAGLALAPDGALWIAESGSARLRRVASGLVTTPLTEALSAFPWFAPSGIAIDSSGRIHLSDSWAGHGLAGTLDGNLDSVPSPGGAVAVAATGAVVRGGGRTVTLTQTGTPPRIVAGLAANAPVPEGEGFLALQALFAAPSGAVSDRDGNLYVADAAAHRVRRITPSGIIATIAGTGMPGYSGDGGAAREARLRAPAGLALDDAGYLYIADEGNHAIRVVSPGGVIATLAGTGEEGTSEEDTLARTARLRAPSGVAVLADGSLVFSDTGNGRILRIDTAGRLRSVAAAHGFSAPRGVATDADSTIYVADSGAGKVIRIDSDGAAALPSPVLSSPNSVAVLRPGVVLVADTGHHRILRLDSAGATVIAGTATAGVTGDGGLATDARISAPEWLASSPAGWIAIADTGNRRFRILRPRTIAILPDPVRLAPRLVRSGTMTEGPAAPGQLVTLFGDALSTETAIASASPDLPKTLGGTSVTVDGAPAGLLYVSPEQINLLVPEAVRPGQEVEWRLNAGTAPVAFRHEVQSRAVDLFPIIQNGDGTRNGPLTPALRGGRVVLFASGLGAALSCNCTADVAGRGAEVVSIDRDAGNPGLDTITLRLPAGFYAPGPAAVILRVDGAVLPAITVHIQ